MITGNLDGSPEGGQSELERLQQIWKQAVALRSGQNVDGKRYSVERVNRWIRSEVGSASPISSFDELKHTIMTMDRNNIRPIDQGDISPLERGAIARLALVGKGMTLNHSDEIAGALNAAGGFLTGADRRPGEGIVSRFQRQYHEGKNENNLYMNIARGSTNEGNPEAPWWARAANPEAWGTGATALLGAEAMPGMGLMGSAAYAGGVTGVSDIGAEENFGTAREHAGEIAGDVGKSAALALGLGLGTHALGATVSPAWFRLQRILSAEGGAAALEREFAKTGTERPMPAEVRGSNLSREARAIRLRDAQATEQAREAVTRQLTDVRTAQKAVGDRYDVLQRPMPPNVRINEILQDEITQPAIKRLRLTKRVTAGEPLTGRALEDVRQALNQTADRAYLKKDAIVGQYARQLADELKAFIDAQETAMPDVRSAWGAMRDRIDNLSRMERVLAREPRSVPVPDVSVKNLLSPIHAMADESSIAPWRMKIKAARGMVGPLYTPATAGEFANTVEGMAPRLNLPFGRAFTGLEQIPATARVINPFFQMEPQDQQSRQ